MNQQNNPQPQPPQQPEPFQGQPQPPQFQPQPQAAQPPVMQSPMAEPVQPSSQPPNFQQPAAQPAFQPPQQPFTQPFQQPAAAPATKTKSKLPLVVGAVLLLLAAASAAVWFAFFNVTKDDYKNAETAVNDAKTAYSETSDKMDAYMTELSSTYSLDSEIDTAKSDFDKPYADFKAKLAAMKDQKALRDNEVKKSYDDLEAQGKRYTETVDGLMATAPDLRTVRVDCDKASKASSSLASVTSDNMLSKYDEIMKPCRDAVAKLRESSVEPISSYGDKGVKGLDTMRGYYEKLQKAYKANNIAALQTIARDMENDADIKALADYGDSDLKKLQKEVMVNDKLTAFADLLASKSK